MTLYLSPADVITLHSQLIERYGGATGLRDLASLESALGRLHSGYYNNLLEEAAALWESLSQNHAFVDGNKRIAFASMAVFLVNDGRTLIASPQETIAFIDHSHKTHTFRFANLLPWLEKHTV